jgi:hypothetical protein
MDLDVSNFSESGGSIEPIYSSPHRSDPNRPLNPSWGRVLDFLGAVEGMIEEQKIIGGLDSDISRVVCFASQVFEPMDSPRRETHAEFISTGAKELLKTLEGKTPDIALGILAEVKRLEKEARGGPRNLLYMSPPVNQAFTARKG